MSFHAPSEQVSALASLLDRPRLSAGAAAAKIDPQDAEFLASVNKSITELAGQPGSQASSTCDRIVASAINMDAVIQSALSQMWEPHIAAAAHRLSRRCATMGGP